MTYPLIRWNGGGGGAVGNDLSIRLGDGEGFIPLMVNLDASSVAADVGSRIRAAAEEAGVTSSTPSDADIARCRCVIDRVEGLPAEVVSSALEACMSDPAGLLSRLSASGVDVNGCEGGGAPLWQNPWVLGGAAALVLGGLAVFAMK